MNFPVSDSEVENMDDVSEKEEYLWNWFKLSLQEALLIPNVLQVEEIITAPTEGQNPSSILIDDFVRS